MTFSFSTTGKYWQPMLIMLSITFSFLACQSEPVSIPSKPIVKTAPITSLAYRIPATLGEGAFWNVENQSFYWVDILDPKLHIYHPATQTNRSFSMPSTISTVVPISNQEALVALQDGAYFVNTENGAVDAFTKIDQENKGTRLNDGKCDPAGRFWVGSMHYPMNEPQGKLFQIAADGSKKLMLDSVTISNGIVWTANAKTMYYIDTPTQKISAFAFNAATGTITKKRTAVVIADSLGSPDGMAIDAEDKLWVGLWNGNAVARFDPLTGKLMEKIAVPAHNVTACAFGGPNLDTLYITTASVDMTDAEQQKFPDAGSIFKVVPGVKGVPSTLFKKSDLN
ncbi:MAG: SMP-30/gluconolactonase/LRE family protein [Saprospiraceae bacterium]